MTASAEKRPARDEFLDALIEISRRQAKQIEIMKAALEKGDGQIEVMKAALEKGDDKRVIELARVFVGLDSEPPGGESTSKGQED